MSAPGRPGALARLGVVVALALLVAPLAASAAGGGVAAPPSRTSTMLLGSSVVTFQESGLPLATAWSVVLNGSTGSSLAPLANVFLEGNGGYAYTIGAVTGYTASPAAGTITVNDSNVDVKISFTAGTASPATYPVTFPEGGLPSGTSWSVQVNGTSVSATAPSPVAFQLPNGTYAFQVASVDGYSATPRSGRVVVSGASVTTSIAFGADIQHVVEIIMENQAASAVLSSAPYQSYLAANYAQATHYYAACHYSYPDYAAMTSGRYFACGNASLPVEGVTNLADLLETANLTWSGYFESMASACQVTSTGSYVAYHDPFILYKDIRYNTSRCDAHVVNSAAFNASVANGTLPTFSYYVPNVYDDCYKSTLSFCDNWLKAFLSPILNSTSAAVQKLVASTVFLIVYDEGEETGSAFYAGYAAGANYVNTWCQNTTGQPLSACGGLAYAVAVSPWSTKLHDDANASDYNLQSTVEWLLGLGSDGGWDGTSAFPAMAGLFTFTRNGQLSSFVRSAPSSGAAGSLSIPPAVTSIPFLGAIASSALGLAIGARGWRARRTTSRRASEPPPAGPSAGARLASPPTPRRP